MIDGLVDGYDFDVDTLFETSLTALLDGFEHIIEREARGRRTPARRRPRAGRLSGRGSSGEARRP